MNVEGNDAMNKIDRSIAVNENKNEENNYQWPQNTALKGFAMGDEGDL